MGIKRILLRNIIPDAFIDCGTDITELLDIPDLGESDDDIKF